MTNTVTQLLICLTLVGCASMPQKVVVTDEGKIPVEGAKVRIIDYTTRIEPAFTGLTDSSGVAALSDFRNISGMWTVFVSKEGFEDHRIENADVEHTESIEVIMKRTKGPNQSGDGNSE